MKLKTGRRPYTIQTLTLFILHVSSSCICLVDMFLPPYSALAVNNIFVAFGWSIETILCSMTMLHNDGSRTWRVVHCYERSYAVLCKKNVGFACEVRVSENALLG